MVTPHGRLSRALPRFVIGLVPEVLGVTMTDHGRVEDDTAAPDSLVVVPYGDRALLVEVADLSAVSAVATALERAPLPGQREVIPAARTVLVRLDRPPAETDAALLRRLATAPVPAAPDVPPVELPVVFDGPDLAEVAERTGRSTVALVADLVAVEFTVAFSGFAPGFAYLAGLPEDLRVPRRTTPRTRVPAGAVGLAGPFAGAYPRSSPGGWQLVGRTDAVLFDVDREQPALLRPGARVRWTEVG
jgi:KipI family sensor histidine kinase inhibitor